MNHFEIRLTDDQYTELAQLWTEYMMLGPRRDEMGSSLETIALNFCEWLNPDSEIEDEQKSGLGEILAFFREKEWREGTAIPSEESLDDE